MSYLDLLRPYRGIVTAPLILSVSMVLAGCASGTSRAPSPDSEPASPGQLIAEGAQVYGNNCARCHNARAAAEKTDLQWEIVIAHMRARANLTGAQARAVQAFLATVNLPQSGRDEGVPLPQPGPSPISQLHAPAPSEFPEPSPSPEASFPGMGGPYVFEDWGSRDPDLEGIHSQEGPLGLVGQGRSLAGAKGCVGCHILEEAGGSIGPSLDDLFDRRNEEFIRKKLRNPRSDNPNSVMPDYALSDDEIDAFMAYLGSLAEKASMDPGQSEP